MTYRIIDNFLDEDLCNILQYSICGSNYIPWEFLSTKVDSFLNMNNRLYKESKAHTHFLILKSEAVSKFSFLVNPLLDEIYNKLKINFVVSSCRINRDISHFNDIDFRYDIPHVDVKEYKDNNYTLIYYINNSTEETILYNETCEGSNYMNQISTDLSINAKIKSLKNRLLIFDANRLHSAPSHCLKDRYVMNLNITTEFSLNL
jgi:hypothetical protein